MKFRVGSSADSRTAALMAVMVVCFAATGCNPVSTVAQIGVKVVGDVVNDQDAQQKSGELMGQPVASADAAFGQRLRTLQELQTNRLMILYPVKDDLLNMYRWAVESQGDEIAAVSKLQNDPDGGQDMAEKLALDAIVKGKTAEQIGTHEWFQNVVMTLRDVSTGDLLRVYDTKLIPEFMGAKYCVLEFGQDGLCQHVRIVGVTSGGGESSLN